MTVSSVGSSSNAAQIATLQKQMQKDVTKLDDDVASGADAQTLQLDQLAVQADQMEISSLQDAQAQQQLAAEKAAQEKAAAQKAAAERARQAQGDAAGDPSVPTQGGTNAAVQPGTAAADGSLYL